MPPSVWVIRADGGMWTDHFLKGGYVGGGWLNGSDLSDVKDRSTLDDLYQKSEPLRSPKSRGSYVGQVSVFLLDMQPGDYVITPAADSRWMFYGELEDKPYYFVRNDADGCYFAHRRPVKWNTKPLDRSNLLVRFRSTMQMTAKTAFRLNHENEFFVGIGRYDLADLESATQETDSNTAILNRILNDFDPYEFQDLVADLMAAIGLNAPIVSPPGPDGGVDVKGSLEVATFAKVTVVVQVKRYDLGKRVSAGAVKQLRQSIPFGGQGAFVTTSNFQRRAYDIAHEEGFPYIGLTNGQQLVGLLEQHRENLSDWLTEKLSL